jgi:predicted DNA-binding transcriptional regulator AlpA
MSEPAFRIAPTPLPEGSTNSLGNQLDELAGRPPKADFVPEQVAADAAATMAGVSASTRWRLHAAAKVPKPNRLGGRTFWRVDELKRWIQAGCPDRRTWEARVAVRRK